MHPPVAPPLPQPDVAVVHVSVVLDWNRYYDSSVPSGQESLSATDIIGADIDEIAAQSKAKVDGINEKLNTIPPTIQGAVYVDEFQETFMEALEKARDTEEQAEQLLSV